VAGAVIGFFGFFLSETFGLWVMGISLVDGILLIPLYGTVLPWLERNKLLF